MHTPVVKVDPQKPDTAALTKAADLIDNGRLVVLPTETVYGIACRADSRTLARLDEVKQRTGEKRYTVHIGRKADIERFVPDLPMRAEKLARTAWPGPVTLVFELREQQLNRQRGKIPDEFFEHIYRDNSIGLRCPDHTVAAAILQQAKSVVVAPSANITDRDPAVDAPDALAQLDGKVDLVLDAGPSRYKKPSTVVRFSPAGWHLLRSGVYACPDIRKMLQVQLLFVCTGNTCRSPIAEGLCRKYLAEKLRCDVDDLPEIGYKVVSAGVMASAGLPPSPEAVRVCRKHGVDIAIGKSRPVTADLIASSDRIFVMSLRHREFIVSRWPQAAPKCELLGETEIADPVGAGQQVYKRVWSEIDTALRKKIGEMNL